VIAEQPPFGPEAEVEVGEIAEVDVQLHAANRAAHRLGEQAMVVALSEAWLMEIYPEFGQAVKSYRKVVDW
jgi:hypothetical protein